MMRPPPLLLPLLFPLPPAAPPPSPPLADPKLVLTVIRRLFCLGALERMACISSGFTLCACCMYGAELGD